MLKSGLDVVLVSVGGFIPNLLRHRFADINVDFNVCSPNLILNICTSFNA